MTLFQSGGNSSSHGGCNGNGCADGADSLRGTDMACDRGLSGSCDVVQSGEIQRRDTLVANLGDETAGGVHRGIATRAVPCSHVG